MRTNIPWSIDELALAGEMSGVRKRAPEIAAACNAAFHGGRSIRTHRSVEFALLEKLQKGGRRFNKDCVVCGNSFPTSWPQARYCGSDCRAVIDREYAKTTYRADPATNVGNQQIRVRRNTAERWKVILAKFGDQCGRCGLTFPHVVYDLHHPSGKASRKDTPSRVIRLGSKSDFERLLIETVLLCANCHRLTHSETGNWAPGRKDHG
jgi:hypothetical protein